MTDQYASVLRPGLFDDQVVVVTGGANGIGRALCERFHAEGAAGIVVADLDLRAAAESTARKLFWKDRRPELYAEWL